MSDSPIRVLLVDDDEGMCILLRHLLQHAKRAFKVHWVPADAAREAIAVHDIDVCLLDDSLDKPPGHTGLDLLSHARAIGLNVPIIMLTELADEQDVDLHAMAAGASDYLVKGQLNARLLERSIRYAIERNRITEALRNSEEKMRRVLSDAPVLVFELNQDAVVTFVEGTALRALQLRPEDMIGRSAIEIYSPLEADTRRVLAGKPVTVVVEFNGAVLEAHVSPTLDASGVVTGAVGVATDITRRVRNERALVASQRALQHERDFITTVLDTMGSLAVVLDREGRIVRMNRACERLTGYTFAETEGRIFWDVFVVPDEIPMVRRGFNMLLQNRRSTFRENYWRTKAGTPRLISWSNNTILDEQGDVSHVVATGIDITDRKQAEKALLATQNLFERFMDNSSGVTFIKDDQLRYVFVNHLFGELLQRPTEQLIGRTDSELFTPEQAAEWEADDRHVLANKGTVTRVDRVSGDRHFLTYKFLLSDVSGRPMIGGQSLEITERIGAELLLRQSEERFQLVAKATNDAVWDWDLASNELWWNANLQKLFRYDTGDVQPTLDWWEERVHPQDRRRVMVSLEAAVTNSQQFWAHEYRFLCGDGAYAYVYDRGYVMRDDAGVPVRMIGAMTDVTQRRLAEEALRASEERHRRIVETAHEGIVMLDGSLAITFANARFGEIVGVSPERLQGRALAEFMEMSDAKRLVARIHTPSSGAGVTRSDLRMLRPDGELVWVTISASPMLDREGRQTSTLVMVGDITARKQAETALHEINDQLEQRVAERTAEIVEMMSQLERAHQAQQRFVADASHDLRTPLTVVRAELDLLINRTGLDPAVQSSLLRIADESRRLENMASDLLLLATIDANESIILADDVQVDDLIFDCVTLLRTLAGTKSITWQIDIEEPIVIRCNAAMFRRALMNVLENAIKYSADAGTVSIGLRHLSGFAELVVADSGIGIPASDLNRVFDRFFRSDLTRHTAGTGLGLAIVRAVVDGHGGNVWIESEPGTGTTVRLLFPISREDGAKP